MNHLQFLLLKLSEECNEIGKVASTSIQLGLLNYNPEIDASNKKCLHLKLDMLNAIVHMLNQQYQFEYIPDCGEMNKVEVKIKKDLNHSIGLGLVDMNVPDKHWHKRLQSDDSKIVI